MFLVGECKFLYLTDRETQIKSILAHPDFFISYIESIWLKKELESKREHGSKPGLHGHATNEDCIWSQGHTVYFLLPLHVSWLVSLGFSTSTKHPDPQPASLVTDGCLNGTMIYQWKDTKRPRQRTQGPWLWARLQLHAPRSGKYYSRLWWRHQHLWLSGPHWRKPAPVETTPWRWAPDSSTKARLFSMHMKHLKAFLKCKSWFGRSGVGSKTLHLYQAPRASWYPWSSGQTLSRKALKQWYHSHLHIGITWEASKGTATQVPPSMFRCRGSGMLLGPPGYSNV